MNSNIDNNDLFEARKIYEGLQNPEDIFNIEFPNKTPSQYLYDYILKKQMSASVNIKESIVARFGAIMTYPLAIAAMRFILLLKTVTQNLVLYFQKI